MRLVELTALPSIAFRQLGKTKAKARDQLHIGGHKYCVACRQAAKRQYNAEDHRRHHRRLTPEERRTAKRTIAYRRLGPPRQSDRGRLPRAPVGASSADKRRWCTAGAGRLVEGLVYRFYDQQDYIVLGSTTRLNSFAKVSRLY